MIGCEERFKSYIDAEIWDWNRKRFMSWAPDEMGLYLVSPGEERSARVTVRGLDGDGALRLRDECRELEHTMTYDELMRHLRGSYDVDVQEYRGGDWTEHDSELFFGEGGKHVWVLGTFFL